jgi:ParB/RepB/Spo0J family partition protein
MVNCVVSIELSKLVAHPDNPNRMSKAAFRKLCSHIKETGRYEPIVVREHPEREGFFEIVNGHHRAKALKQIGLERAECVVWELSEEEADILLTTLNRLRGSDNPAKKSAIIQRLLPRFDTKHLAALLPNTRAQIERLKNIAAPAKINTNAAAFDITPIVFMVSSGQKETINAAIAKAMEETSGTAGERRAAGIVKMAEAYRQRLEILD